jgi:hypothetical protein
MRQLWMRRERAWGSRTPLVPPKGRNFSALTEETNVNESFLSLLILRLLPFLTGRFAVTSFAMTTNVDNKCRAGCVRQPAVFLLCEQES